MTARDVVVPSQMSSAESIAAIVRDRPFLSYCPNVVMVLGAIVAFAPLIDGGTTHLPVLIIRLAIIGTVTVWAIRQCHQTAVQFSRTNVTTVMLVFLGWAGISLWWTPYKSAAIQWLLSLLIYALFFAIVVGGIKTGRAIKNLVLIVMGVGLCEGGAGLVQYAWLGESRARGTFFNPNFFATFEVAVLAMALGLLTCVPRESFARWERLFVWGTAIVASLSFFAAQSRGALLALVVAGIVIGIARWGKASLVVVLFCLLVGGLVPNPLKQRIVDVVEQDPYAYSRVEIWKSSLNRLIDHPAGVGLGMYKYSSFQYRFPVTNRIIYYEKRAESAHNEYLQIAVELGVIGLGIFLAGIALWGWETRHLWRNQLDQWEQGLITGLTGAVIVILSHAGVDSVFHEPALVLFLVLSCGLVLAMKGIKNTIPVQPWNLPIQTKTVRVMLVVAISGVLTALTCQSAAGWYAYQRGGEEARAGRQEVALDWFHRAIDIAPGVSGYHDALARTFVQLFHQSGSSHWLLSAVQEEHAARELNALDARTPYRLGTIYELLAGQEVSSDQRGKLLSEAAEFYEEAIRADPYAASVYLELANLRLLQNRADDARTLLQRAITVEPNLLPARVRYAQLAVKDREFAIARKEYEAIIQIRKKYEGLVLTTLERQFLDVDLKPLERALSLEGKP